ncbi:MAG: PIN domain-containing protein [Pyrinomonadaceae bacterium]
MTGKVIADTVAIVGFLSETDQWHENAFSFFKKLPKPFYTCEAVITESCFLLRDSINGEKQVLDLIANDVLRIDFSIESEVGSLNSLMSKYKSVPMSLADACLVRMTEILDASILTYDTDFEIYRKNGRHRIPLIGVDDKYNK